MIEIVQARSPIDLVVQINSFLANKYHDKRQRWELVTVTCEPGRTEAPTYAATYTAFLQER